MAPVADVLEILQAGRVRDGIAAVRRAARSAPDESVQLRLRAWRAVGIQLFVAGRVRHAQRWVRRSLTLAESCGAPERAAEALNTLAGFAIERGHLAAAVGLLGRASRLAPTDHPLHAHLASNLGTIESIRGNLPRAATQYRRAHALAVQYGLRAVQAHSLHNLAILAQKSADWHQAGRLARAATDVATELGDDRLLGMLGLVSARSLIEQARLGAAEARLREAAGALRRGRAQIDFPDVWVAATRIARLREDPRTPRFAAHAVRQASRRSLPLSEGEAEQEFALWQLAQGDNIRALTHLSRAVRLMRTAGAVSDARSQQGRLREVVRQFVAVVRRWGRSLEAADSYTFGHSERVARYSVELARALDCDAAQRTTIRVGAYLHDVGKMRVPNEVLNKPGRLDADEMALVQRHPEYGVALLKDVELPWDVLPIVRWHHEHADGSGYPDKLVGEAIPLAAQIVSVADVFDALTSTRPYRPALSVSAALDEMYRTRQWWAPSLLTAAEQSFIGAFAV